MPFRNPIVAGLTLIRAAIRSSNFVAGVSGWSINRDGTAEFNDVTARGDLLVGTAMPGPGLTITSDPLPAELLAYYSTGVVSNEFIKMMPGDGSYHYEIVKYTTSSFSSHNSGFVDPNSVVHQITAGAWFEATGVLQLDLLNVVDTDARLVVHGSYTSLGATLTEVIGKLQVDGRTDFGAGVHINTGHVLTIDAGAEIEIVSGASLVKDAGATIVDSDGHNAAFIDVSQTSITFAAATSNISNQTFSTPFATAPRIVIANIASGAGAVNGWIARTDNYTTTGFRLILSGPSAAWSAVTVIFLAIA